MTFKPWMKPEQLAAIAAGNFFQALTAIPDMDAATFGKFEGLMETSVLSYYPERREKIMELIAEIKANGFGE